MWLAADYHLHCASRMSQRGGLVRMPIGLRFEKHSDWTEYDTSYSDTHTGKQTMCRCVEWES